ncbi:SGNH/GDSL hydrolase family protein [Cutibacterium sp. V947]|uniref:SGNH/GDSL hydrolase family protein n=1 Tax=Cutibacterium sp. V947 TaxID=3446480 RepID=UPI003EE1A8EF
MKRVLRILSVGIAAAIVVGVALGLQPEAHTHGWAFDRHRKPSVATAPAPASSITMRSAPGPTGHGGTLVTAGFGDSVPQGNACSQCTTFIERVGTDVARRAGVRACVDNESVSGYKTTDVLTQLEARNTKTLLQTVDLAIVTIGANDFDVDTIVARCARADQSCVKGDVDAVTRRVRTILQRIKAGMPTPGATVVVTGYWNVGMDGKVGRQQGDDYVHVTDTITTVFNAQVEDIADEVGAVYVDVRTPFKGADGTRDDTGLLADDGDHPSQEGHAVLAKAVEAELS